MVKMENASKALIMAAEVLIGVLIISLAVYLFTNFGQTSKEINEKNREQQIVQYNTRFTSYLGRTDLTIYDVITVANLVIENNTTYAGNSELQIVTGVRSGRGSSYQNLQNKTQAQFNVLIQNDQTMMNGNKLPTYTCTSIEYYSSGRIKTINFSCP